MICPACEKDSDFLNVDEHRFEKIGMAMCQACGFITYPEIIKDPTKLADYYRTDYRGAPTGHNLLTAINKWQYHNAFLGEYFPLWRKQGDFEIFEIGAAFGFLLTCLRQIIPNAIVHGSELTRQMRAVAFHEYGIALQEDFNDKPYDLIISYKVLEHMIDPLGHLKRYAKALKDNGFLYISVPCWFEQASNFGNDQFDLREYYDKRHINVWTRGIFEMLLRKAQLKIIKENHVYYNSTYLCVRSSEINAIDTATGPGPDEVLSLMHRLKVSAMLYLEHKFEDAKKAFNNFPLAHIAAYEKDRNVWHQKGFEAIEHEVLLPAISACPDTAQISRFCADIYMRYNQYKKALKFLDSALTQRPNELITLIAMANCYRMLAMESPTDADEFTKKAIEITKAALVIHNHPNLDLLTHLYGDQSRLALP